MMPHRGSWRRGRGWGWGGVGGDLGSASQLRDNKTVITISDDHKYGSESIGLSKSFIYCPLIHQAK